MYWRRHLKLDDCDSVGYGPVNVREHLPCGIGEIDVRKGEVGRTNQRPQRRQEMLYVKIQTYA